MVAPLVEMAVPSADPEALAEVVSDLSCVRTVVGPKVTTFSDVMS